MALPAQDSYPDVQMCVVGGKIRIRLNLQNAMDLAATIALVAQINAAIDTGQKIEKILAAAG